VTDTHELEVDQRAKVSSFEIVVYHAETGETLGSPVVLPLRDEQLTVRND
jgi:hypothetical protein